MPIKVLVDVAVLPSALKALEATGKFEFDLIDPPEELARPLDPQRIADAEVMFTTFLPTNAEEMKALKWVQISSAGYTQLFDHKLTERGIRATNGRGCFRCADRGMEHSDDGEPSPRHAAAGAQSGGRRVGSLRDLSARDPWHDHGYIGAMVALAVKPPVWARAMGLNVHVLARNGVGPRGDVYHVPQHQ